MYDKLHQAEQKELQAKLANQEKSRFLSTVSHDMRTPLNGILGLTDLMLERNVDEQMNQDLLQLKNSGQYLLALINDTLDISKIERGDLELHPTVCNGKTVPDQGTLQNKRILLCEDHPLNARIVIRLLESRGCQVIQAENGKEGLLRFAGSTPG